MVESEDGLNHATHNLRLDARAFLCDRPHSVTLGTFQLGGWSYAQTRPRPARRSLMVVAIMILGFWTAREMVAGVPATLWFGLALAWIALAGAIRGWACRIALGAAVAFGSAGWWTLRIDERSASSLAWSAAFDGPVTVFGETLERLQALFGSFLSKPAPATNCC